MTEGLSGGRSQLIFLNCEQWRLGSTNDEGWYRGQCRYSNLVPEWGEFYEIKGCDPLAKKPIDWHVIEKKHFSTSRHFLFYLRDSTFECFAESWILAPNDRYVVEAEKANFLLPQADSRLL